VDEDHRVLPFGAPDVTIAAGTQQAGVGDQDDTVEAVCRSVVTPEAESTGTGKDGGAVEAELDCASECDVGSIGKFGPFDHSPLVDPGRPVSLQQVPTIVTVDGGVLPGEAGEQLDVGVGSLRPSDGDRLASQQQKAADPVDPQQVPILVGRGRFRLE